MPVNDGFSAAQWAVLNGALRLTTTPSGPAIRAADLLDPGRCEQWLAALTPVIGSPSLAVTASLLGKRFSFLATGGCLYAMSACDQGLPLSLDHCFVEFGHEHGRWVSAMPVGSLQPRPCPRGERDLWRREICASLFAGLLQPLWHSLAQVSRVSRRILWENTAVRVYSLYDKRLAQLADPTLTARCADDFDWLLNRAEPAVFGLDYNPLKHFRRSPCRRTCCFYYLASDPVEYCKACPLSVRGRK